MEIISTGYVSIKVVCLPVSSDTCSLVSTFLPRTKKRAKQLQHSPLYHPAFRRLWPGNHLFSSMRWTHNPPATQSD